MTRLPAHGVSRLAVYLLLATAGALAPRAVHAQWNPRAYPEVRVDGTFGRASSAYAGIGPVIPLGYYVRVGLVAEGGLTRRDGIDVGSGRFDVTVRYLLDPFRETRDALSLGGGVTLLTEPGKRLRPYLVVLADLEGRRHGSWTPALQLGLGGGARIGVALRRSTAQNR